MAAIAPASGMPSGSCRTRGGSREARSPITEQAHCARDAIDISVGVVPNRVARRLRAPYFRGMTAAMQRYAVFDTAFGACGIAWGPNGLTRLRLPACHETVGKALAAGAAPCDIDAAPAAIVGLVADIRRYFAGEEVDFSAVPVALPEASAFEQAIYAAAQAIGYGYTVTYGELARRAGFAGASRETGQALGRNPIPLVIPCHRVVASDGRLGGFSAPGGNVTKERMLALEGARLPLL